VRSLLIVGILFVLKNLANKEILKNQKENQKDYLNKIKNNLHKKKIKWIIKKKVIYFINEFVLYH
jgi:hypothetical protein